MPYTDAPGAIAGRELSAQAFVHERDSRRKQIVDAVVATGQVSALAYQGRH